MMLPEPKNSYDGWDKVVKPSADVLARVKGFKGVRLARYFHGIGEWQIDGMHGSFEVVEWWPVPEPGTGYEATR